MRLATPAGKRRKVPFGFSIAGLGSYLQILGMVSLLLVGVGMLLEAASAFAFLGNAYLQGYDTGAGGALWGVLAGLLLLISFVVISAANQRQETMLALGLILPIAVFGFIAEITLPVILLADLAYAFLFGKLLRKYPS